MPLNARAVGTHLRAGVRDLERASASGVVTEPAAPVDRVRAQPSDVEMFVLGLYDLVLAREPDEDGFAANVVALRAGTSRADMLRAFVESAEALARGREVASDGPLTDTDAVLAHGIALVARARLSAAGLDDLVTRVRAGIPATVLVHELDPTRGPEPWQSLLVRHLLRGLPAAGDATVVDRALVKVGAYEEPEAVLALAMPGRDPLTRLRRFRRASRALAYTTIELAATAASPVVPVPVVVPATTPKVVGRGGDQPDGDVRHRDAALVELPTHDPRRVQDVRVVEVDSMLIGVPSEEWRLAAFLQHRGHPEPGLAALMLTRLRPGGTFVDVGANLGLYTVAAGRAVGAEGRVVAVEPTPTTAEMLRQNVRLNGLWESGVVEVHECAAGAAPGRARLAVDRADSGHNSLYPEPGSTAEVDVEVVRLDDLIPAGAEVDVVKIDVEGAELAVLRGMERIVAQNPGIVVFAELADEHLRRAGSSAAALIAETDALGWSADVFETVSGDRATLDSRLPLTVCLVRRDHVADESTGTVRVDR
jgi:FkbM family methyltransferase